MIALIIKGTPAEARAAMLQRGIGWNDSFVSMAAGSETLARAASEEFQKIVSWFAETSATKAPFAAGTLLHYTNLGGEN